MSDFEKNPGILATPPKRGRGQPRKSRNCEICGHDFASPASKRRHVLAIHENIRPFECQICGKTFTRNELLRGHQQRVHFDGKIVPKIKKEEKFDPKFEPKIELEEKFDPKFEPKIELEEKFEPKIEPNNNENRFDGKVEVKNEIVGELIVPDDEGLL